MPKTDQTAEYSGRLIHETDRAKLIDFGLKEDLWVPKRLIQGEVPGGQLIGYMLPVWWAVRNGLE